MDLISIPLAKAILTDHGISFEMKDGKIIVEDEYIKDGELGSFRRACPETEKALFNWLGY